LIMVAVDALPASKLRTVRKRCNHWPALRHSARKDEDSVEQEKQAKNQSGNPIFKPSDRATRGDYAAQLEFIFLAGQGRVQADFSEKNRAVTPARGASRLGPERVLFVPKSCLQTRQ